MSVKDVNEYYDKLGVDYLEMMAALKDLEEECGKGLISPDKVDQFKKMLEPIKINYSRISYIMYLLNKPNKKEKQR